MTPQKQLEHEDTALNLNSYCLFIDALQKRARPAMHCRTITFPPHTYFMKDMDAYVS